MSAIPRAAILLPARPISPYLSWLAALALSLVAAVACSGPEPDAAADAHRADVDGQGAPGDASGADAAAGEAPDQGSALLSAVVPDFGPSEGGTTIEVRGQGLEPTQAVWIGASQCLDLQIVDDQTLRCRTPPQPPGFAAVQVIRQDTTKRLPLPTLHLDAAFQFVATVRVDSVQPSAAPAGSATLVTVQGAGFLPGTSFLFGSRMAIGVDVQDEHAATMWLPPAPETDDAEGLAAAGVLVDVIATNVDGQGQLDDGFRFLPAKEPPAVSGVELAWVQPDRLDPAGGTAMTLRYSAPPSLGALLGVRIGSLDAAKLGPGPQGPQSASAVAPAGSPGRADVRLYFASGVAVFKARVQFASALPRLVAVLPSRGGQAGGTLVDLVGDGVDSMSYVRFGDKEGVGIEVEDAGLVRTRTPPAAGPGAVSVLARFGSPKAPLGQNLLKNAYVYFDPAQQSFGTWGGPLERALNVTVQRAGWPGGVVQGALVVIGDGLDVEKRGITDHRGQVVISTLDLRGPLDVSASAGGFGAATLAGTASENATLLIREYPQPGSGEPPVWPKNFYGSGTILGRVINADKVSGLPRGRCKGGAAPGEACAPCGPNLPCGKGLQCLAADAPVWPPGGVTATATGLCMQPCIGDGDCGEGLECRYGASQSEMAPGLPSATTPIDVGTGPGGAGPADPGVTAGISALPVCLPRVGVAQTRCEVSKSWMFSFDPDPGPGAIVKANATFELKSRLGSVAVACRRGYVAADDGAFVPLWFGVTRNVELPTDKVPVHVDVVLDHRLGRQLAVRMSGLPMGDDSLGKRRHVTAWLSLEGDGVLELARSETTQRTDLLTLHHLPTALHGALGGLRLEVYGGLQTVPGDQGAPLSLGHFIGQQVTEPEGIVSWPQLEPAPILTPSGALPTLAAAVGKAGAFAVGRGGRILHWSGLSFTPQAQPIEADLLTVWLDPVIDTGWIGGAGGVLLRRHADAGWFPEPSPTVSDVIGVVGAAPGVDAGALWLLDRQGVLWLRSGGAWAATPKGPWQGASGDSGAALPPDEVSALRRLADGSLVVLTLGGAVHRLIVPAPTVGADGKAAKTYALPPAFAYPWSTVVASGPQPLFDAAGAGDAFFACGGGGALLAVAGGKATALKTGTSATLYGLLPHPKGLTVVGAGGTWLEGSAAAGAAVDPAAWTLESRGPAGATFDLRAVFAPLGLDVPTGPGRVAIGEPALQLGTWLEMPRWVSPQPGEPVPSTLQWATDGGAAASLQFIQITTFWQISYWDIVAEAARTSVTLPDFMAIGGWQPLPGGPLRMRLTRAFAPGLSIDHFAHDQLSWYAWTTWAFAQQLSFVVGSQP